LEIIKADVKENVQDGFSLHNTQLQGKRFSFGQKLQNFVMIRMGIKPENVSDVNKSF